MQILNNFLLKDLNTFGMDVKCAHFVRIEQESDIQDIDKAELFNAPCYILGGGSNTLFTKDFDGTVIQPDFKGIEIKENNNDNVLLRVAAGEKWEDLINYCIENQYYGIENLVGIPGLVGSSPVQNIGAYGVELKDCFDSVEGFYIPDLQDFILTGPQCQFGYRNSVFKNALKNKCLITHVLLRLSKIENYTITYRVLYEELKKSGTLVNLNILTNTILQIRNSKLPDIRKIGCAGSFFQNPLILHSQYEELLANHPNLAHYPVDDVYVKISAGQLIEMTGWRGKRVGNVGIYPQQALVLVNYGNATPQEIIDVYENIIHDVYELFNIRLQPEVNII